MLADVERTVDVDLDEVVRLLDLPVAVAVGDVGRDEGRQVDDAGLSEELGHLADAADVLVPVLGAEPEIAVQPETDVVAVEHIAVLAAIGEDLIHEQRHRGFA